jgi:hypothetical protein
LLRREGLYSSHLTKWRAQRERGALAGLAPKKRGPTPQPKNVLAAKVAALEREVTRYKVRAERAEALVELQKNHRGRRPSLLLDQKLLRRVPSDRPGGSGRLLIGES